MAKHYIEGVTEAFADGGCIGPNPSRHGGTWAFRLLRGSEVAEERSGVVTAREAALPAVSNNYTELLACLNALSCLPEGWAGTLYSDSWCTVCRLVNERPGFAGIPTSMVRRVWFERERLGRFKVVLLDGHPTVAQLAVGVGKRGNPVSEHNVACDEVCTALSLTFLARVNGGDNPEKAATAIRTLNRLKERPHVAAQLAASLASDDIVD